jgi:hypothetical protein
MSAAFAAMIAAMMELRSDIAIEGGATMGRRAAKSHRSRVDPHSHIHLSRLMRTSRQSDGRDSSQLWQLAHNLRRYVVRHQLDSRGLVRPKGAGSRSTRSEYVCPRAQRCYVNTCISKQLQCKMVRYHSRVSMRGALISITGHGAGVDFSIRTSEHQNECTKRLNHRPSFPMSGRSMEYNLAYETTGN